VKALCRNGLRASMGRVGACDNATMESFFALLQ
jgi:transposase InsO family protein